MKRFFAALGKAALCGLFLWVAACNPFVSDGYTWFKASWPASSTYVWLQIGYCGGADYSEGIDSAACTKAVNNLCTQYDEKGNKLFLTGLRGCASPGVNGVVRSRYTEAQAKALITNGRSHFEHEVGPLRADGSIDDSKGYGHLAGYDHKELHMRGI